MLSQSDLNNNEIISLLRFKFIYCQDMELLYYNPSQKNCHILLEKKTIMTQQWHWSARKAYVMFDFRYLETKFRIFAINITPNSYNRRKM